MKDIPPAPPGWNKTVADLVSEMNSGLRKNIRGDEAEWARNYERTLLPEGLRFPRKGDIYEAIDDLEVDYLTSWFAPYTGGGRGTLMRGERIVVDSDPSDPTPLGVYAKPENYKEVEMRIVPEDERTHYKYGGFYFQVRTLDLNTKFRLVAEGGAVE